MVPKDISGRLHKDCSDRWNRVDETRYIKLHVCFVLEMKKDGLIVDVHGISRVR